MKPSEKTLVTFYRQLGKLFYAIADADRNVAKEEVAALKRLVQSEWVPAEASTDAYGSDAAYQIEIVFEWLLENDLEHARVLPDFKRFHDEHHSLFSPDVNARILRTAHAIAGAFAGENRSEKKFIRELEGILGQ